MDYTTRLDVPSINTTTSDCDYRNVKRMSFSGLKEFAKSPLHYVTSQVLKREATAAMELGTLVHLSVLQPLEFSRIVVTIDGNRNANSVKDAIKEAESSGKFVTKSETLELIKEIQDSVLSHPIASRIFSEGQAEASCYWDDPATGLKLKGRFDWWRPDNLLIADLKVTGEDMSGDLSRHIAKMKYHWQSALYCDGASIATGQDVNQFVHVFVENKAPYGIRVVVLDSVSLDRARSEYRPLFPRIIDCQETNQWPGYPPQFETIQLPAFNY